jgi:ribonuclease HII
LIPRPPPPSRHLEFSVVEKDVLAVGVDEAGTGAIAGPVLAAAVWLAPSFDEYSLDRQHANSESVQQQSNLIRLHDSKVLSTFERSELFLRMQRSSQLVWTTGAVSAPRIDEIGVQRANGEAMAVAINRLERKLLRKSYQKTHCLSTPLKVTTELNHSVVHQHSTTSPPLKLWLLVDGDILPESLTGQFSKEGHCDEETATISSSSGSSSSSSSLMFGGSAVVGGDRTELCIAAASLFAKVESSV